MTAAARKSLTDLTRRKGRTVFTVLTLALAVASVGLFALPALMEQSMQREAEQSKLPDLSVSMEPLELTGPQLAALADLPNVEAVEPRSVVVTRVWVGERRERALVIGVPGYADQEVDVVSVSSGAAPGPGEVLTDRNNAGNKSFDVAEGDGARLIGADGGERTVRVSGVGRNLTKGENDPSNDWITFYATPETVAGLRGAPGYTTLAFLLDDGSREAAGRTVAAVRDELRAGTGFTAFDDLPLIQEPGGYPGKAAFESLASLFVVITLLALLSALVLVSNTMTTLIGEQTGEIAAMKAIGARRRDLRRIYLRTALMLGALGAVVGVVLGVVLANVVTGFFASVFFGVDAGFGVSVPIVVISLVVGFVAPALAALPAIRRAGRLPLNEALSAAGSAVGGQGRLDLALRRVSGLPRSAQIGLRGLARRKRRSLATTLQISLAVATLLALLSVGAGVGETTRSWFDGNRFDIWVQSAVSGPLGPGSEDIIESTDGVARAEPWLQNEVRVEGRDAQAWGLPMEPLIDTRITDGRWHTAAELASAAPVVVLGPTIAKTTGRGVGDSVRVETGSGPADLRVIGVSGNQADNGDAVFLPLSTLQTILGSPGRVNSYWIATTSDDHGLIDRTTTQVEDRLAAGGHQVGTLVNYDMREQQVAANAQITTAITVLGLLIVAISMVALINTITMSVLERTREIGVLRSIGARGRDVRAIFATEGIALAVAGWLLGVPLGYVLARVLVWAAGEAVGLSIAFVFPLAYLAIALAGTVALALAIMIAPLRRAVRLRPGEAIRVS